MQCPTSNHLVSSPFWDILILYKTIKPKLCVRILGIWLRSQKVIFQHCSSITMVTQGSPVQSRVPHCGPSQNDLLAQLTILIPNYKFCWLACNGTEMNHWITKIIAKIKCTKTCSCTSKCRWFFPVQKQGLIIYNQSTVQIHVVKDMLLISQELNQSSIKKQNFLKILKLKYRGA